MDWLTFASKMVESLAWPLVVLILAFALRSHVKRLLGLLSKIKAGPIEAEFAREVEDLRREVEAETPPNKLERGVPPHQQRLLELAAVSPRAAVLEAWQLVEFATRDLLERRQVRLTPREAVSPLRLSRALNEIGGVSSADLALFNELRSLRNAAVHAKGFELTADAATNYIELAARLYETIRALDAMLP